MRIISTHEQADFDALASMLGAHLLDEDALPVLPSKLNRNLQAFLTLYGAVLPFIDRRDLPNQPIEMVILVDTQSMVSIRGMRPDTTIQVIDHHPSRKDLPENWQISTEETGANTTIFIEALVERGIPLNTIHATLLLLGIYEDTGSLTYSRTTARDLRAAAYLVEHGADLKIANNFLNHPLSLEQERLYEELKKSAILHKIQGHNIIVALGDARAMNEELSTIAHKMRNVLEPDALILLVETRGGVQLIARSTNDDIDVASIANHFGGGGHTRAAASLIKDGDTQKTHQELLQILPESIQPAITVAQIMSRAPQVLPADTPAVEAALRMQRYGYEGYPVVEHNQLVGLLTRRAVDRAISHNLNLTAKSLMQAGKVTVEPEDSLDYLQQLMTETGWGQIPVVRPGSHEIIGIVTRTDLLKTLSQKGTTTGKHNLSRSLESVLPAARLALIKETARVSHAQRSALYIVGGFVRDLWLQRPSLDLDLVVEGDAIQLARALQAKYGGRLTTHHRFGTAKWHIRHIHEEICAQLPSPNEQILFPDDLPPTLDLISARTEFYTHPSALPIVERGSIKLDLHRRDFTINTLALRLDGKYYGELHDYWGGLNDLQEGLVRVLHSISFVDDPTRILRAVRYEKRYHFQIEDRTLQLLVEARPLLSRVTGERLRHEFDHMTEEENWTEMFFRLEELEILATIHNDLTWDAWMGEKSTLIPDEIPADHWRLKELPRGYPLKRALIYALWMIRLSPETASEILKRLVYPRFLINQISATCKLWACLPKINELQPSQVSALLDGMPPLAIYTAFLATDHIGVRPVLEKYSKYWRDLTPSTTGHDLRRMGLSPGPRYQTILTELRNAWLDGQISSPEEEADLLSRLLSGQ